ncbi:DNA topoisomerase IB [Streptomyces sp. NBC_00335]|uniref:DNA topoisomerase IB n=1 Tax=unclassified Streptomyces TaxID=2593676 RepID=UPI0022593EF8|nr:MULTISPECIES: DNA topoisomerase IB [unclassified Streptomyces]MCX5403079.1 DNA topoisomerase IB [Streptomyces sp. NBC_00086]
MRLRTSRPDRPGCTRRRAGSGFRYVDSEGRRITDDAERSRMKALVIPPAWQDVWICPWGNGHIQAMGTDAAGRRQYLYHERFRELREASKHDHVVEVSARLPFLRKAVEEDLSGRGLVRDRVLACVARLLDLGFFRIGGASYRRDHEAYGLTTLLREHARCARGRVRFDFPGKSAQQQIRSIEDPASFAVVRALLRRDDRPQLFVYRQAGAWRDVRAEDVNEYLRDRAGADLTAKDFRTWHATVLAAVALAVSEDMAGAPPARRRSAEARAVREVSHYLGNTPAVCRASYINPRVVELFENGVTIRPALDALGASAAEGDLATHGAVEDAVRRLLAEGHP